MTLYKYKLNREQVIEKAVIDVTDDFKFKNYYLITNAATHPYLKKNAIDRFSNNISAGLYLTVEDDAKAVEHFGRLLNARRDKLYAEYQVAESKLNNYKGAMKSE